MTKVITLNGESFPQEKPERETETLYIYSDGRIVFKQSGLDLWGDLFREAGIDINAITNIDAFNEAAAQARQALAQRISETAEGKDNPERWEALRLIIGGGDLEEARKLIKRAEIKDRIKPV